VSRKGSTGIGVGEGECRKGSTGRGARELCAFPEQLSGLAGMVAVGPGPHGCRRVTAGLFHAETQMKPFARLASRVGSGCGGGVSAVSLSGSEGSETARKRSAAWGKRDFTSSFAVSQIVSLNI